MNISHYGFVCLVSFSNKKYIRVKKKKFLDIFWEKIDIRYPGNICEFFPSDEYYFYSNLQVLEFTNYSYSYSYRSWLCESIPIPIRGKNCYSLITAPLWWWWGWDITLTRHLSAAWYSTIKKSLIVYSVYCIVYSIYYIVYCIKCKVFCV